MCNVAVKRPLLNSYEDMPDPFKEQIQLDLKRTFTDDDRFSKGEEYLSIMENILCAYAKRNPSVGYWQGMNYLAGMMVRVFEDEEDCFWALWTLFENILPLDYFCLMTEILIDQKVFISLIQKKKKKLFKHLKKIGLDFALISFQWFVWLLSSNLVREVAESVWDLMFWEGTVVIFRAALAILNILEPELMKQTEFNDMYLVLDSKPKQMIDNPELLIKHISKYQNIKAPMIDKLRDLNRPIVMEDQKNIWIDNSRSGWPTDKDSPVFRRIKLLNKFFLLNKAIRRSKVASGLAELQPTELKLSTSDIKCNIRWPLCLYDFSIRSRISNFFVYKVAKPVKIIPDYFQDFGDLEEWEEFESHYTLVPFENKNVTIYDTKQEK